MIDFKAEKKKPINLEPNEAGLTGSPNLGTSKKSSGTN